MPISDQKINKVRYQVIPRTLIFAFHAGQVLLMKLTPRNGKSTNWTGRYNGPGGHIEQGEDILTAARRELLEETGLEADLSLSGTIMVDTARPVGISLFIFKAENASGELLTSDEGKPEWIPLEQLAKYPLVEDVVIILDRIGQMKPGDPPFAGRSSYDAQGRLELMFG